MPGLRIVHTEAAIGFGGQEHRIYKEVLAMRERGHHIEVVCQPHAKMLPRLRAAGFVVHTIPMGGLRNYVKGVYALWRLFMARRYDVVNTHSRMDTIIAAAAGRLAGVPLVVRTRHLSNKVTSMLSYTWLPHRVTAVSDHVRGYLIQRGVPPERIATVYSPVALPPQVEHSTLRSELGLSDDHLVVGCVAVMRATKGHRDLVDAMAPLIRENPMLHMVFVGGGSPTFEQVHAYVQAQGLGSRIHLMGMRDDVPNLLAGFDLFALATQQEASGTVYVEAAASGLPVVGTNVGGVSEMMREGITGILVPPKDPVALGAALKRLIDDPELRCRMGDAGRRMVWEERAFSTELLAERTENLYRQWLAERGHRASETTLPA
ncbi:glycosyltransferase family 4 protein [Schauerella aestuarii]|uniref:glycosyltransferase family 4 protein n=1 Tax=Schauerella aestuarii TaxID=2511204 RepID=UPI00136C6EDB|nr:glycosyltransferase family 4 protein [Achromobacter aestuarii]MYZ43458.1 glycosyltransferase family 1 protein [Achromobacter aestuarii]